MYLPPIAIIISTAIFYSLAMWWTSGASEIQAYNAGADFEYLRMPFGVNSFTNTDRQLYMPLLTLLMCHAISFGIFSYWSLLRFVSSSIGAVQLYLHKTQFLFFAALVLEQTSVWFMIPLLQRLMCGSGGAPNSKSYGAWYTLKCLMCGEAGLILIAISTQNPALALLLSIFIVPITVLVRPSNVDRLATVSGILLVLLSPPMLFFIGFFVMGDEVVLKFLYDATSYWELYGAIILPCICLVYWPLNMAAQVVNGMQLSSHPDEDE